MENSIFDHVSNINQDIATVEDVAFCFRLLLGRPPSAIEWPGHSSRSGEPLSALVTSYLKSAEFNGRELLTTARPQNIVLKNFDGFSIFADRDDKAVGVHVAEGMYDPEIECVIKTFVRPGMTVLDIGANIGFFTMLARSLVGPNGKVIAIEPNCNNARMLEASRRRNGFKNVQVIAAAASDKTQLLALYSSYSNGTVGDPGDNPDNLMRSTVVPAFALDSILLDTRADFIKINVEGNELLALTGLKGLLERSRPTIVSEFAAEGVVGGADTYLEFLLSFGYALGVVERDGTISMSGNNKNAIFDAFQRRGEGFTLILSRPAQISLLRTKESTSGEIYYSPKIKRSNAIAAPWLCTSAYM